MRAYRPAYDKPKNRYPGGRQLHIAMPAPTNGPSSAFPIARSGRSRRRTSPSKTGVTGSKNDGARSSRVPLNEKGVYPGSASGTAATETIEGSVMTERGFFIDSVLLCDDIRREVNGKAILIGVYSGDIIVPTAPTSLGLGLWLQGRAVEATSKVRIRLESVSNSTAVVSDAGSLPDASTIAPDESFLFALSRLIVQIAGQGHLSVCMKYGDRDWVELFRKKVLVNSAASNEPPP
jgi:hypothetical protein